jgi:hypothetical protein
MNEKRDVINDAGIIIFKMNSDWVKLLSKIRFRTR